MEYGGQLDEVAEFASKVKALGPAGYLRSTSHRSDGPVDPDDEDARSWQMDDDDSSAPSTDSRADGGEHGSSIRRLDTGQSRHLQDQGGPPSGPSLPARQRVVAGDDRSTERVSPPRTGAHPIRPAQCRDRISWWKTTRSCSRAASRMLVPWSVSDRMC